MGPAKLCSTNLGLLVEWNGRGSFEKWAGPKGLGCAAGQRFGAGWGMRNMTAEVRSETAEEAALAQLIVSTLNLEVAASDIDPETPLFGEGLGLDSIDILEIALAVSQTYGVKLKADDEDNVRIFRSLRSLNDHIQQQMKP